MKKIYKTISICLLVFFPWILVGQAFYDNQDASFEIIDTKDFYQVKCTLKKTVQGSRTLQLTLNRLRLKSVDLVGIYILFEQLKSAIPLKNEFFTAFVNYVGLRYEANIKKFSSTHWENCNGKRCVSFFCKKADFSIENNYSIGDFDVGKMLMLEFKLHKNIKTACLLNDNDLLNPKQQIDTELMYLNGNAILNDNISQLLNLYPNSQLENSLYSNDSIMNGFVDSINDRNYVFCDFGKLVLSKIFFTCASLDQKDEIYQDYLNNLEVCNGIWYETLSFIAKNRDNSDFLSLDESTVFDVIEAYPGALNIMGLRKCEPGANYDSATIAFSNNNFELALKLLKDEINNNGISPQALNLVGASYRLLDKPDKALPYLILAFYVDKDTKYLTGNTCLCLRSLSYKGTAKISEYFFDLNTTDDWSKQQIKEIINNIE